MSHRFDDAANSEGGKSRSVTVYHLGPQDQDLRNLADILSRSDWNMCPDTQWTLSAAEDAPMAPARLPRPDVSIVLCDGESLAGSWKDVLVQLGRLSSPPVLIVTSRAADEYLWAEALNLGAYDVLAKPYQPAEVERVLSMAWLHWMNRRGQTPAQLAQAS
jgi:DNA-binding response OmpR family regulator